MAPLDDLATDLRETTARPIGDRAVVVEAAPEEIVKIRERRERGGACAQPGRERRDAARPRRDGARGLEHGDHLDQFCAVEYGAFSAAAIERRANVRNILQGR